MVCVCVCPLLQQYLGAWDEVIEEGGSFSRDFAGHPWIPHGGAPCSFGGDLRFRRESYPATDLAELNHLV